MNAASRYSMISRLNKLPLNQAAEKLLPSGWGGSTLHVLALAFWGSSERSIYQSLEGWVVELEQGDPEVAMRWVTETPEGEEVVNQDALDNLGPEDGASVILNQISDRLNT
jgi:hypothetical protein